MQAILAIRVCRIRIKSRVINNTGVLRFVCVHTKTYLTYLTLRLHRVDDYPVRQAPLKCICLSHLSGSALLITAQTLQSRRFPAGRKALELHGRRGTEQNTNMATGQWARIPPAWESPSPTQGLTFLSYLGLWELLGRLLASANLANHTPRFAALVTGMGCCRATWRPTTTWIPRIASNADMMGSATSKP